MSLETIDDSIIELPSNISSLYGELCFIERTHSCGKSLWYPGMIVGPYDIPLDHLKSVCISIYKNVSRLYFCIYSFVDFSYFIYSQVCQSW
jgi:hypothetical protein